MDSIFSGLWGRTASPTSETAQGTPVAINRKFEQENAISPEDSPNNETNISKSSTINIGGMTFQRSRGELSLAGYVDRVSYFGFKVCNAALYMQGGASSVSPTSVMDPDVSKELVIGFLRYVPAVAFAFQTRDLITKNGFLSAETRNDDEKHAQKPHAVHGHVESFNGFYQDVNGGDVFSLKYDANGGTSSLCLNGENLGSIQSRTFSRALFSVWFGEHPFMASMKEELLKGSVH